ncbi:MAG: hypothetical protein ABIP42_09975, partial [Planctomycetota bacterium]
HAGLVADLGSRLSKANVELSAWVEQREKDAEQEFSIIQREKDYTREVPARIKRINDFLATYADTESAKEHGPGLRDLKQALESSLKISFEDKLRSAYGREISFPVQSRARLNYEFTSEASPRWNMGDWKRSAEGWSADRLHSRAELENNETLWPRLLLEEPLDLNAAMSVEIEFQQPQSSGTPRRFIVSIAGVHIGFAGPPEAGVKSQVASKAGGADAMKDLLDLLDQRKGKDTAGLERGNLYKLRVDLFQGRGQWTATLNGQDLLVQDALRPQGRGGSTSIVLRSLEPILVKAVRIDAGVRK